MELNAKKNITKLDFRLLQRGYSQFQSSRMHPKQTAVLELNSYFASTKINGAAV
jgi:hypothetical protein